MKLGDHVRALVNGEYRHGIGCGDRTVLFLARHASGRPEVRRALVADFAAGAGRVEAVVHREPVFPPRAAVARAFSRMRDPVAAASFRSSEEFAAWCLTGRPPEPGFAPAAEPARPAPAARRVARKKKARARPARTAAPERRSRKAAPRPALRGKKAATRRRPPRSKRRR